VTKCTELLQQLFESSACREQGLTEVSLQRCRVEHVQDTQRPQRERSSHTEHNRGDPRLSGQEIGKASPRPAEVLQQSSEGVAPGEPSYSADGLRSKRSGGNTASGSVSGRGPMGRTCRPPWPCTPAEGVSRSRASWRLLRMAHCMQAHTNGPRWSSRSLGPKRKRRVSSRGMCVHPPASHCGGMCVCVTRVPVASFG
jgi:hypothetical protein